MFHEHPLKILKHAVKNIWLLIFPVLRGIRSFSVDLGSFLSWIRGAWFDILVILLILGFGYFRWLFTFCRLGRNHLKLRSGIFIKTEESIPYENISAITAQHSFYLRPFGAARLSVSTRAKKLGEADMILLLKRNDLKKIQKKLPQMQMKKRKSFEFKPKWNSILFFSFIFSSSFSGVVYLSTFIFHTGRIISDFMQDDLANVYQIANNVSADVSTKVSVDIPPVALILGFIIIGTWLFSFISNILRYSGFIMKKGKRMLRVITGAVTKRVYHIIPHKINYVDLRQNLLMKIFRLSSVNISCSGYGRSKNELPVLLPILNHKETNRALEMLEFEKYVSDRKVKPETLSFTSYISIPTFFAVVIPIAGRIITNFFPGLSDIVLYIAIMLEIPLIWLIIVKLAAYATTGITMEDDFCCIRYSRFYAFHTILADKSKLVKIQIFQDIIDEKFGRCRLDFYFASDTVKVNKVKGLSIKDAKKIIEKFEFQNDKETDGDVNP